MWGVCYEGDVLQRAYLSYNNSSCGCHGHLRETVHPCKVVHTSSAERAVCLNYSGTDADACTASADALVSGDA